MTISKQSLLYELLLRSKISKLRLKFTGRSIVTTKEIKELINSQSVISPPEDINQKTVVAKKKSQPKSSKKPTRKCIICKEITFLQTEKY